MSFSTEEKTNLLFKKLMSKPSTLNTKKFFEEPNRPARPAVIASKQIWATDVPDTAPSDLSSITLDDNGNSIYGSFVGKTSTSHPQIKRYINVPLTMVVGSEHKSYESQSATRSHHNGYADGNYLTSTGTSGNLGSSGSYGRVLQDTIPFNYDPAVSYDYKLYKAAGTEISPGENGGDWVLDTDSGILTFYNYEGVTGIDSTNPPNISFYRYVGTKGVASSSSQKIFTDGTDDGGSHLDTLNAIQVDDANIATIGSNNLSLCLQFGATTNGAWRLAAIGGGGDETQTRFVIQVRKGGIWYNKMLLNSL